jgi:uncharacterized protein involved in exopolysaccharide biosynthesis
MEQTVESRIPENKNAGIGELIRVLYKGRKVLLVSFVIAIIGSVIFSSPVFFPSEYKSEIIFYPPSHTAKVMLEYDLYFGVDKEIDESIQILKSSILRDSLIKKYRLMEHYEIDPTGKFKLNQLYKKIDNNIKVERTRYNSISVTVFDTDPTIAANMANDMVKIGDEVKFMILKQNLKRIYETTEKENLKQLKTLDTLSEQINRIDGNLFKTKKINLDQTNKLDVLKTQMDIREMIKGAVEKKSDLLTNLLYEYESKFNQYTDVNSSLKDLNRKINSENINSFVITPAEVADKKTYPVRWLIVVMTAVCDLLITAAILLLLEKYKELNVKLQK